MDSWPDIDNGVICGECFALIDNMSEYKTCDNYCSSIGLVCNYAAEETGDSCHISDTFYCDFDFDGELNTSDALCECRPSMSFLFLILFPMNLPKAPGIKKFWKTNAV